MTPKSILALNLLDDTQLVQTNHNNQHTPLISKSVNIPLATSISQTTFNAFPSFPVINNQFTDLYKPQTSSPLFEKTPVHALQDISSSNSENLNILNPLNDSYSINIIGNLQCNIISNNRLEAEKNIKINQVLSMYEPQKKLQEELPPANNQRFKPLGAIAAQHFFNQSNHHPYPAY